MNLDQFWEIVDASRRRFDPARREGNLADQAEDLRAQLSKLSPQDIMSFGRHFAERLSESYRWDLTGAAYAIDDVISDDAFHDFRCWLVSLGRSAFEAALANPDSLAKVAFKPGVESSFFEGFSNIAAEAYRAATGIQMPFQPTAATVRRIDGKLVIPQPAGEHFDFEDAGELRRRYPRLWWPARSRQSR